MEPLQEFVRSIISSYQDQDFLLILHDWSWLSYFSHSSKKDRIVRSNKEKGYEALTALAVSSQNGAPIAPVNIEFQTAEGVYTSRCEQIQPCMEEEGHQEALQKQVHYVETLHLGAICVHIIDRVADSVGNFRFFDPDAQFVIRGKNDANVEYQGKMISVIDLAKRLPFRYAREAGNDRQRQRPLRYRIRVPARSERRASLLRNSLQWR